MQLYVEKPTANYQKLPSDSRRLLVTTPTIYVVGDDESER